MDFEEKLLCTLINNRDSQKAIAFKKAFETARKVLIAPAPEENIKLTKNFIDQLAVNIPNLHITLLRKETQKANNKKPKIQEIGIGSMNQGLWKLLRNPHINMLRAEIFDTIIDLDPNFNFTYAFLCRRLAPLLRICFTKEKSEQYYNLQYTVKSINNYESQLSGMLRFLNEL
ncbi:hypothetical protein KAR48_10250 [bacterium]|nr:hypothetical protein [bacterium]